jgi:hypothetical protein
MLTKPKTSLVVQLLKSVFPEEFQFQSLWNLINASSLKAKIEKNYLYYPETPANLDA